MNGFSTTMTIISAVILLSSAALGEEQLIFLACYALLFAILVEIGCVHESLKKRKEISNEQCLNSGRCH